MTKDEAMQQALEALKGLFGTPENWESGGVAVWKLGGSDAPRKAIVALEATLEQAEPPPEWEAINNIIAEYGLQAIDFVADWKAAQPVPEPVACRFCHSKKGCWTWQCYNCGEIDDVQKPAPPPVQEPVSMRMPKVGDKVICLEDESLGEVVSLTAGGSPDIKFADGSRGTYLLREFAELFGYAEQRQPLTKDEALTLEALKYAASKGDGRIVREMKIAPFTIKETLAQPEQEPVAWDKPSASFDEWWDGDRRRDTANPFDTDSFAYWAWEGWQAALAQRPWQGLTEEEIAVIGDKVANEDLVGLVSNFRVRLARAVEQTLKERNK